MKTGLVLEGGALRAIFSSGVCDGLLDGIQRRTPEQKVRCDGIIDGCMDWLCRETGLE